MSPGKTPEALLKGKTHALVYLLTLFRTEYQDPEKSFRDRCESDRLWEARLRRLEETQRLLEETQRRLGEAQRRLKAAQLEAHEYAVRKAGERSQEPEADAMRIRSETRGLSATKPVSRWGLGWWWYDPSGK